MFEYLLDKKDFDGCEEVRLLAVGFLCRGEIKRVVESGVLMIGFSDSFPIVPFLNVLSFITYWEIVMPSQISAGKIHKMFLATYKNKKNEFGPPKTFKLILWTKKSEKYEFGGPKNVKINLVHQKT